MSTLFLLYVYMCLLRTTNNHSPPPRVARSPRPADTQDPLLAKSTSRLRLAMESQGHTGSFYLRLGAVGFGVGAMILEGLVFGQLFEVELTAECIDVIQAVTPVLHLVFIFTQMYFIFLNGRMGLSGFKLLAGFGLMHMFATNICVLLRTVVKETMRDVHVHEYEFSATNQTQAAQSTDANASAQSLNLAVTTRLTPSLTLDLQQPDNTANQSEPVTNAMETNVTVPDNESDFSNLDNEVGGNCKKQEILGKVVDSASPYLYPCTVAYCLIAAGVLFMMWRRLTWRPSQGRTPSPIATTPSPRGSPRAGVDCTASNRGLFLGVFTMVAVIISMIVFFVLIPNPHFIDIATMVTHGSEAVLHFLTLIAIACAAVRIRNMCFVRKLDKTKKLEQGLLLISLGGGSLLLCVFNIMAGSNRWGSQQGSLLIATNSLVVVQSLVQTVFILCCLHRSARTVFHVQKKPGREYITFLLMCNIAMWGIYTFEVMRMRSNPVAIEVYGYRAWSIVTHVTIPLAIFYRFHSTVCLAAIWSNIYKKNV